MAPAWEIRPPRPTVVTAKESQEATVEDVSMLTGEAEVRSQPVRSSERYGTGLEVSVAKPLSTAISPTELRPAALGSTKMHK